MPVTINGTSGITTPGIDASGTNKFATTIGVGGATPAASGAGITFPATQSASSDANTLDDYEEGTWTPTSASGGWTMGTIYRATYTKIGNRVWLAADLGVTGTGNGNQLRIGGLPFTVISNGWSAGNCYFEKQNTDFWSVSALPSGTGGTYIVFQVVTTAGNGGTMIGTDIGAGYVNISAFYEVA